MEIKVDIVNKKYLISFPEEDTEIDVSSADDLKNVLNDAILNGYKDIYIDMKNVVFIDSTGLGVLVNAMKHTNNIYLLNVNEEIKSLIDTTRLTMFFKFGDNSLLKT